MAGGEARLYSEIAERVRQRYRERVQARSLKSYSADPQSSEADIGEGQVPAAKPGLEDIQRRAREDWLQLRAVQGQAGGRGAEHHPDLNRGREDDLAL